MTPELRVFYEKLGGFEQERKKRAGRDWRPLCRALGDLSGGCS